jgi:hypothetical protein
MLSGINASYSFWGGSFLAWAVIGPALVATGKAFGTAVNPDKCVFRQVVGLSRRNYAWQIPRLYKLLRNGSL